MEVADEDVMPMSTEREERGKDIPLTLKPAAESSSVDADSRHAESAQELERLVK